MSSPDFVENTYFVLPIASVQAVQHKFENYVVGFFVGKKVAFTIVKNYVTNTWAKFGFEKIMSDDDGLFYFKFSSGKGVEQDEVTRVPVWVKLHKVPVVAYSADGLSLIASQIRNPIMLDDFTSAMCVEAWGRIGYARALIEVCADKELKQEVAMAIPKGEEVKDGHSVAKIRVEYEWKPPVCIDCKVFGHTAEQCPKKVVVQPSTAVVVDGDGFTTVVNRKSKGKGAVSWQKKNVGGFKVNNAKNFVYQPVKPKENASKPSTSGSQKAGMESSKEEGTNGIKLKNLFEKLNDITYIVDPNSGEEERCGLNVSDATINQHNDDSESDIEEVFVEENPNSFKGARTPVTESHVDISLLSQVCSKVFKAWDWTSNANLCTKGCRIILGWNVDVVNVLVLSQTNQAMHVKIVHKASNKIMYYSFIYAGNKVSERRVLCSELGLNKQVVRACPWILLGDFNVALNLKDSHSGSSLLNSAMLEFKDCVSNIEVMDINSSGLHFTWNQKPKGGGGILRKLDRIMGNLEFLDAFPGAHAYFHPYRISDHSPAVTSKLKALKKPLRNLVHDHGNLHDRVKKLRCEPDEVQRALDLNPTDQVLYEEEVVYVQAFNEAVLDEERFLKQKAKIEWLDVGDSNSAYFHKSLKIRNQRSCIEVILNADNVEISGPNVPNVFVQHYEKFLGTDMACDELNCDGLFHKQVSEQSCSIMVRPITDLEIKTAMFSIGDDKAPGPDGYTSAFFKRDGILLVMTKILTNRIIEGIKEVVSDNQSAFVSGRRIYDNILLTQELMYAYHRDIGPPRCAFKIDIQKAYDTVDWHFMDVILKRFGFPPLINKWIMACVSSTSFLIGVNGDIHGFFKGKRGLRQGDPLSPRRLSDYSWVECGCGECPWNKVSERRVLWYELGLHKQVVRGCLWILLRYFNVALNLEDSHSGSSLLNATMLEFKDCVSNIEVMDINSSGLHFTWNQKPKGGGGILRKLDRILGNLEFLDAFPGAHAYFHPYRILDHSPAVLKIPDLPMNKPKPFKFFNFITHKGKFLEILASQWNVVFPGHHMYQVTSKLKALKKPLRKLVHDHGNLHDRVKKLRCELDEVQRALDLNPIDQVLCEEEATYVQAFNEAVLDEERFLKQKAKIEWLDISSPIVPNVFVQHHEKFLGTDMACYELNCDGLFHKQVSEQSCSIMGWDIVGHDVCKAVHDFFINGQLLKEINHTFIALIPKEVVSDNQSAFVPGRHISDNILLTQELIYAYHRDIGPPRCAFKIDIQKAYDMVDWHFMDVILKRFDFPPLIKNWIMDCVSSTSFSIGVNGDIHRFFKGKRGLRQDDLFIFARGDVDSAPVIRDSLEEFTRVSGLVPSLPKSTTFFCIVANHVKLSILHTMPFSEGKLLVIYLGVPLIPTRLFNRDCKFLVKKARNRIGDRKNKSLSFAGRLQLCSSVISSMHVYWASILMIPTGILLDIEQLMRGFLWCNGDLKRGKAKVAWNTICLPKCEGGLGIHSLEVFNIALMTTHIWNIVSNKESLWVRWINAYKLKGRSFWDVPLKNYASWRWRKLIRIWDLVRPFFRSKIGNGHGTSVWFDRWCDECPLIRYLSPRDVSHEGFSLLDKVSDMVSNEVWKWPQSWLLKAPILGQLNTPLLDTNMEDTIWWRDGNGVLSKFSVKAAWALKPRTSYRASGHEGMDIYSSPCGISTRSDHGTKRCRQSNPSSSSNVLDHSSSSHHVDENIDENDEESSHSNTPSPSQLINSLSNIVPRVFETHLMKIKQCTLTKQKF
ncbi:hypothetical protein Tco_1569562 [Tanacetum coccineum]